MDEVDRTRSAYESDADGYIEKYLSESIAARYGESFIETVPGPRLLDLGCGPGPDTETFDSAGFDVTAVDISRSFLRVVDERFPESTAIQADMRSLPIRSCSFDGIWASASFHHVPQSDAAAALRECRRLLRTDGCIFVSAKRDRNGPEKGRHFEYYRPEEFRNRLTTAGFEPERFETDDDWVWTVATY